MIKTWQIGMILLLAFWGQKVYAAEEVLVKDLGQCVQQTYIFEDEVYLSRDGSCAQPVQGEITLEQPGHYFLTSEDEEGQLQIETFEIIGESTLKYNVKDEAALMQAVDRILTQGQTDVSIDFRYAVENMEDLKATLEQAFEEILYTYPSKTYVRYSFLAVLKECPTIKLHVEYPENYTQYNTQLEEAIIAVINQNIMPEMTDYERQDALVDYIIRHVTYNKGNYVALKHTLQGALFEAGAVCDGYAYLTMYLLNAVGVPTQMVIGTAEGEPHAWNLVEIQDAYYHMDTTWADQERNETTTFYHYINETDSYMRQTHAWDEDITLDATDTTYTCVNKPQTHPGTYKVHTPIEWLQVKRKLQSDGRFFGTLIFDKVSTWGWDETSLIQDIMACESGGIRYQVEEKYDVLVIMYEGNT